MLALILNGTDQSEETAALVDLVENGANLLRAVDCLLRDIHTLSGVSGEFTLSESVYRVSTYRIAGIFRGYKFRGNAFRFSQI